MKRLTTIAAVSITLAAAGQARADQIQYVGVHPLAAKHDAGFCYIEFPHVHVKAPPKKVRVLYRVHDDRYYFVGDPEPFGYDGEEHPYYGHHPVHHHDYDEPEFCYIDGPHFHVFAPAVARFELKGGAHWYVGEFPEAYERDKRRYQRVNAYYRPIEYERPVVEVQARPAAYVGPVVGVHVDARAEVVVPPPPVFSAGISIEAGFPGIVVVEDDHHHHRKHKHKHKGKWKKRGRKHEVVKVRKKRSHKRRIIRRH